MTIQTEQLARATISSVDIQSSSDESNQIEIKGPGEFRIDAEKCVQGNNSAQNFGDTISHASVDLMASFEIGITSTRHRSKSAYANIIQIKNPLYHLYKLCFIAALIFNLIIGYLTYLRIIPFKIGAPWAVGFILISFSLLDELKRRKYIDIRT